MHVACSVNSSLFVLKHWSGYEFLSYLEDYQKAGEEFWPKYDYVAKELGEGAKPEQVLKVMETLANVAMREKVEEKIGPFGFNKGEKRWRRIQ